MNCIIQTTCKTPIRQYSRKCAVGAQVARLRVCTSKRAIPCGALRREVEGVSFADVYLAMQERVATNGTLPKRDGLVMVESIRNLEQAQRALGLIARHVASRREMAGALELDWPVRKKWLTRICEAALRLPNGKPLILDVFANADVFALSTYFAAETLEALAAQGAELALLTRLVELFRSKRPVGDKGVAAAYHRLLAVVRERKDEAATKAAAAALKEYLTPALPAEVPAAPPAVVASA
ncbi:hypothetical protein Vretimale_1065 [Volvox reticuliferus]|uniref:Uncharacterized protein n=1 Tax=Volvox reticuliferus TaxID=1737510 RepID=A0A8J4FRH0_9CHLO|nr:hypothetical protein Vretifemale_10371 [Volvox reticuliferus]GIL94955.1 hypothetical protein Vretimale_1065 [Volvox reticuliferus]